MTITGHAHTGRVEGFAGPYRWASNYSPPEILFEGIVYPTREHAFAAAKTLDLDARRRIADAATPGAAKKLGRHVELRPDWDDRVRYDVMDVLMTVAFQPDTDASDALVATGDALLVESNTWHDQHWGRCTCPRHASTPGRNELGRALMWWRRQLQRRDDSDWTRVMCTGHRPKYLTGEQQRWVSEQLERVAVKLRSEHGMRVAIHGAAIGSDLAWAAAAANAGVDDLWAYVPFPQQADQWRQADVRTWRRFTATAEEGGWATLRWTLGERYDVRLLHARNHAMISDCDAAVVVHDPAVTTGGTVAALDTIGAGRPIVHLDPAARTVKIRNHQPQ